MNRLTTRFHKHWTAFFIALILLGIAGVQAKLLIITQYDATAEELVKNSSKIALLQGEIFTYGVGGCILLLCNIGILAREKFFGSALKQKKAAPRDGNRWQDFSILLILFYLISFCVFYTLDGTFTKVLSTTPYCYSHPVFKIYQPLFHLAWKIEWYGGREVVDWYGYEEVLF
jgi:hypothetical protein